MVEDGDDGGRHRRVQMLTVLLANATWRSQVVAVDWARTSLLRVACCGACADGFLCVVAVVVWIPRATKPSVHKLQLGRRVCAQIGGSAKK